MSCAIFGALVHDPDHPRTQEALNHTWNASLQRGRDSWGLFYFAEDGDWDFIKCEQPDPNASRGFFARHKKPGVFIGNRRAEPTTEWVKDKRPDDIQPFFDYESGWCVAHNGILANDKNLEEKILGKDCGWKRPTTVDSCVLPKLLGEFGIEKTLTAVVGSFALVATRRRSKPQLLLAANYKPIFVQSFPQLDVVASQAEYFLKSENLLEYPVPVEIPPYSYGILRKGYLPVSRMAPFVRKPQKVLAVCSGGLDSVTAVYYHQSLGDDVELLHFDYGCKAGSMEIQAISKIAAHLKTKYHVVPMDFFSRFTSSSITDKDGVINRAGDGEAGTELAHEWVPARNTVMLALATAFAESNGFDVICLGNNLEESGAYPDNEQEFVNKFQAMLPYAVNAGKRVDISQPCATLVKHEIVALGLKLGVPYELTWSCYDTGPQHCTTCGPCQMRRTAFAINKKTDPVMEGRVDESGIPVKAT